ncbi:MAG: hypothetical protein K8Q97_03515 [Candidatus Andersenbacteria bacterium]|nr:hypothetical protein [Candidatus Andersenbacteria bacterium]
MPTTLRTQDLTKKITEHTERSGTFRSWRNGEHNKYFVVKPNMEPDREFVFGWCPKLRAFYVSSSVPISCQEAVLQMVRHRTEADLSHLESVQFALNRFTGTVLTELTSTLRSFYREEATDILEPGGQLSLTQQDIVTTAEFLAE